MNIVPRMMPDTGHDLTIERVFAAPRELVFRMWSDGSHMRNWACPKGFTIPHSEGDVRPGGRYRTCMRAPDGEDHWLSGTYLEVRPFDRLSFTHGWQTKDGHPGPETTVTVEFEDAGAGTRLVLHQAFFATADDRDGHAEGWNGSLDNLAEYLKR